MANKVILVVSFGTSYKETREKTIEALEKTVAERYKDWEVRRAFTSKIIIKKLKERDGIYIEYISEALQKLVDDGVKDVVVMPTHVMNGTEYDFVKYYTESFTDKFDSLRISTPLLTTEKDYDKVIDAINEAYISRFFNDSSNGTAIVFMGHGSEHFANPAYSQLQLKLWTMGYEHVYVTTVEGFPSFDDTMRFMAGYKYSKIILAPFMLVAGDHATNDMASDDEDSLKSRFISSGCDVRCILEGLGEQKAFQELFIEHLDAVMKQ